MEPSFLMMHPRYLPCFLRPFLFPTVVELEESSEVGELEEILDSSAEGIFIKSSDESSNSTISTNERLHETNYVCVMYYIEFYYSSNTILMILPRGRGMVHVALLRVMLLHALLLLLCLVGLHAQLLRITN